MLLLIGLCVLFKVLLVEGCSFNQKSLVNLIAAEQEEFLPNSSSRQLPPNATCQWNITAPVGKVFHIRVQEGHFIGSCSDEHLTIYDGSDNSSVIIAQYCNGTSSQETYFFTSGGSLFVEAKTKFPSYAYMRVFYRMLDFKNCSRNTTLDAPESPTEKNFSSPYYPVGFRLNTTCGWYITAPENYIVKVQLISWLSPSSSSKDRVEAYDVDGSELSAISLDLDYYGATDSVYSKFREVFVLFKSDLKPQEDSEEQGIFVSYTAIKITSSCSSSNTENQNQNIMPRNFSGIVNTPGYPSRYPSGLAAQCIWKIIAPKGQVIRLDVLSLRMGEYFCGLTIQNGVNTEDPVEIHRGTEPSFTVYSTGRELSLKVHTYICTPGPGFIANYSFVSAGSSTGTCILENKTSVHISGEGGSFVTPKFPHPGKVGTCSWNITVPPGKFVKLSFWTFEGLCDKNYAEVFHMTDSTSEALTGKFCKQKVLFSKGSNVHVRYSTKQGVSEGGFFASYEALEAVPAKYSCSNRGYVSDLTGTSGEFASFDYPLTYPNDASCKWKLKVPPTHLIQINFHSFDLQQSQDCKADYVEIKRLQKVQGSLTYVWQVFRKLCGSSLPASYRSNYSSVSVHFVSDSSGRFPGFHASFSAVPNPAMGPCKRQGVDNVIPLTGTTGRLFSPLYPQAYPPNMTCTWMITVPEGHFVKLRITSFRLESTCDGPVLQIRDGQSESSNLLKTFWGREFESSVFSSSRHLWVRFKAPDDEYLRGNGFTALFEAVTQLPAPFSCTDSNRIVKLQSDSGTLASYIYPLPYDKDIECVWVIVVDSDYRIKLSFDFFNLSRSSDCSEDYVEVRDGEFDSSDLLGKFCGSEKPESITSDIWDLSVAFKSSGRKKFPGFKASYETKKSTAAILKIVGIVLGVLSALCTIIAASCKFCKSHNDEPAIQGSPNSFPAEHAGTENLALKEQTTQM